MINFKFQSDLYLLLTEEEIPYEGKCVRPVYINDKNNSLNPPYIIYTRDNIAENCLTKDRFYDCFIESTSITILTKTYGEGLDIASFIHKKLNGLSRVFEDGFILMDASFNSYSEDYDEVHNLYKIIISYDFKLKYIEKED